MVSIYSISKKNYHIHIPCSVKGTGSGNKTLFSWFIFICRTKFCTCLMYVCSLRNCACGITTSVLRLIRRTWAFFEHHSFMRFTMVSFFVSPKHIRHVIRAGSFGMLVIYMAECVDSHDNRIFMMSTIFGFMCLLCRYLSICFQCRRPRFLI